MARGPHRDLRPARARDAAARSRAARRPLGRLGRVPMAVGRVHGGPPPRSEGDLVTAATATPRAEGLAEVLAALDDVADPEIPAVSIVELGMIGDVDVRSDSIRVEILPTFVGCPAIELITAAVADRLSGLA